MAGVTLVNIQEGVEGSISPVVVIEIVVIEIAVIETVVIETSERWKRLDANR